MVDDQEKKMVIHTEVMLHQIQEEEMLNIPKLVEELLLNAPEPAKEEELLNTPQSAKVRRRLCAQQELATQGEPGGRDNLMAGYRKWCNRTLVEGIH